jgi:hypothetical protein
VEDRLIIVDGATFVFSSRNGDVAADRPEGFFFEDVRHLSRWCLTLDGKPLDALTSRVVDHFSARFVGAKEGDQEPTVSATGPFSTCGSLPARPGTPALT